MPIANNDPSATDSGTSRLDELKRQWIGSNSLGAAQAYINALEYEQKQYEHKYTADYTPDSRDGPIVQFDKETESARLWDIFVASGLVTGAWIGSPWDDLPTEIQLTFINMLEALKLGQTTATACPTNEN